MSSLAQVAAAIQAACVPAVDDGLSVYQRFIGDDTPVRTGNLKNNLTGPGAISVQATSDGAEGVLNSGVDYDAYVNDVQMYWERGIKAGDSQARAAIEARLSTAIKGV